RPSRRDLSHPGHLESRAHGRRRSRRIRPLARRNDAQANHRRSDWRHAMSTRRNFLWSVFGAVAAAAVRGSGKEAQDDDLASARAAKGTKADRASKPLRILILGGTGFLGPHLVENARARGHTLSLFNRGKPHPELFPEVEKLRGDRNG